MILEEGYRCVCVFVVIGEGGEGGGGPDDESKQSYFRG